MEALVSHLRFLSHFLQKPHSNSSRTSSVISESYVLTAAHCIKGSSGRPSVVRLGEQNLATRNDGANPIDYRVSEFIPHPNYSIGGHYYDIGLIKLSERVEFNSNIRPSCLWQTHGINSTKAIATGWGSTGHSKYLNI